MILCKETVDFFRGIMVDPQSQELGLTFKPLSEIFEESETAIAKHVLYKQYLEKIEVTDAKLPKVFFYIVMDEIYKVKKVDAEKKEDRDFGYCVRFKD